MQDPLSILVCHDERSLLLYFQGQRFFSAGEEEKAVLCRTGADEEQLLIPLGPDFGSSNHDQFWPDDLPTSLYCAARVDCSLSVTTCREVANGAHLVSMPGMAHLLVSADTHPLPDLQGSGWKKDSAAWRRKSGIADAPASGVIWYRKDSGRFTIWPAVEVKASASEHLETACGSASLALALKEKCLDCCSRPFVEVVQPSGQSLFVFHEHAQGRGNKLSLRAAWVAGPVSLAAQGRAFL